MKSALAMWIHSALLKRGSGFFGLLMRLGTLAWSRNIIRSQGYIMSGMMVRMKNGSTFKMRGLNFCFYQRKLPINLNAPTQGQRLSRSMNRVTEKTCIEAEAIQRVLSQVPSAHGWLDQTKQNLLHFVTSTSKITVIPILFQFHLTKNSVVLLMPRNLLILHHVVHLQMGV
uniref:Uncharacterized protein n=1 Tax=Zea mays TaxID=4577 RepID=C0PDZ7_MAIZE|nr:unknown [Zea mays]|eukprot:NP_001169322.1 uncharacterized LOC100383188 [Zea mays]